jgi:hypothetical protein
MTLRMPLGLVSAAGGKPAGFLTGYLPLLLAECPVSRS